MNVSIRVSANPEVPLASLISIVMAAMCIVLLSAARAYCQPIEGIYVLGSEPPRPIPHKVLDNPAIDGIALRYSWDELEPKEGIFNWTGVDQDLAQADHFHKKVSLSVTAGARTPYWVYNAGAALFTFPWDRPWGHAPCSRQSIPVPWDSVYLSKWKAFVRELGRRYASNRAVICIKLTGINGPTQETQLPHSAGAQMPRGGVSCPGSDTITDWLAAGYTRSKVNTAWLSIADTFADAFPTQELALMIGPRAFPPIDDSGRLMPHRGADMKLTHELIDEGMKRYGARLVVQNNGLSAVRCWLELSALASHVTVGYQMLWEVTHDPRCRMNGGVSPCIPQVVLRSAFDRGIQCGARYLEVYLPDVLNPALGSVIAQAHQGLTAKSPTQ